jgi:DNA-binding SARP family transcriptional activator
VLQVLLIGTPQFRYLGVKLEVRGKPAALLALIAAHHPTGLTRSQAERYLWGREAAQNLRQAIYGLRQLPFANDWLLVSDTLFLHNLTFIIPETDLEWMQGMDGLLSDEGLEWLSIEREKRHLERRENLLQAALQTEGQPQIKLLEALLALDPLHESAVQLLIKAHLQIQSRAEAIEVLERFKTVLRSQLGGVPLAATVALLETETAMTPALERYKRAYAVVGRLDTALIAKLLERDELEVAEVLTTLEPPNIEKVRSETPLAVWQLLNRRAAQALTDSPERAAQHWLEAGDTTSALNLLGVQLSQVQNRLNTPEVQRVAERIWQLEPYTVVHCQAALALLRLELGKGDFLAVKHWLACLYETAFGLQNQNYLVLHQLELAGIEVMQQNAAQAEKRCREALQMAELWDTPELKHQAQYLLADILARRHQLPQAAQILSQLPHLDPNTLLQQAGLARTQGQYQRSVDLNQQAITILRTTQNYTDLIQALNDLGVSFEFMYEFTRAEEVLKESLLLRNQYGQLTHESTSLGNLAKLHIRAGRYGFAYNTAIESLEIADQYKIRQSQAANRLWLGEIEYRIGRYDQAFEYLDQAYSYAKDNQNSRWTAAIALNLEIAKAFSRQHDGAPLLKMTQDLDTYGYKHNAFLARAAGAYATLNPELLHQFLLGISGHPHPVAWTLMRFLQAKLALLEGNLYDTSLLHEALEAKLTSESPLGYAYIGLLESDPSLQQAAFAKARQLRANQAEGLLREMRIKHLTWQPELVLDPSQGF